MDPKKIIGPGLLASAIVGSVGALIMAVRSNDGTPTPPEPGASAARSAQDCRIEFDTPTLTIGPGVSTVIAWEAVGVDMDTFALTNGAPEVGSLEQIADGRAIFTASDTIDLSGRIGTGITASAYCNRERGVIFDTIVFDLPLSEADGVAKPQDVAFRQPLARSACHIQWRTSNPRMPRDGLLLLEWGSQGELGDVSVRSVDPDTAEIYQVSRSGRDVLIRGVADGRAGILIQADCGATALVEVFVGKAKPPPPRDDRGPRQVPVV